MFLILEIIIITLIKKKNFCFLYTRKGGNNSTLMEKNYCLDEEGQLLPLFGKNKIECCKAFWNERKWFYLYIFFRKSLKCYNSTKKYQTLFCFSNSVLKRVQKVRGHLTSGQKAKQNRGKKRKKTHFFLVFFFSFLRVRETKFVRDQICTFSIFGTCSKKKDAFSHFF